MYVLARCTIRDAAAFLSTFRWISVRDAADSVKIPTKLQVISVRKGKACGVFCKSSAELMLARALSAGAYELCKGPYRIYTRLEAS